MLKLRPNQPAFVDLPFPIGGLDESMSLERQRKLTSADLVNVRGFDPRSGRLGGARRSGLSKFLDDQITPTAAQLGVENVLSTALPTSGIQDINSIALSRDLIVASGHTLAQGTATTDARRYNVTGGTLGTTANIGTVIDGCFDADGNGYAFGVSGTTMKVVKIAAGGSTTWTTTVTTPTTGYNAGGCAVREGTLYVYVGKGFTSGTARLYRFNTSDGTQPAADTDGWKQSSVSISNQLPLPADTEAGGSSGGFLAIVGDRLGVCGQDAKGGAFWLVQYDLVSGASLFTSLDGTNGTSDPMTMAMCADLMGNFYVAYKNGSGSTLGRLVKVDSVGAVVWSVDPGAATKIPNGLAYDQVNGRIVGVNANGTLLTSGKSTALISTADGSTSGAVDPSAITTWRAIASDGLGAFRLVSKAGASSKLIKLASDVATVSWTVNLSANGNWVASTSDYIVEPVSMHSTRVLRGLAVSGGSLFRFDSGDAALIKINFLRQNAPVVFSDQNGPYLYYVDGTQYQRYDAYNNVAQAWTAAAGTLPSGTTGEKCRLICTWRARTVLAGLRDDPQNWFMSRIGDATDYNYSPASESEAQAVAGNNSQAGKVGDAITCLVPYSDDLLLVGGDHSIWQLAGDPRAGGRFDLISGTIGMAWGRPYCKDPSGAVWFFSSRCGVYRLVPGQSLEPVSQAIDDRLHDIDLADKIVTMLWDDRLQHLHLFITSSAAAGDETHYCLDVRSKAWFLDKLANANHNPKCCYVLDGDAPGDRVLLLGSWDGYLRHFDPEAADDDGTAIDAYAHLGPIQGGLDGAFLLARFQAIVPEASADITWGVKVGQTCAAALAASPQASGTLQAGRSLWHPVRLTGRAAYLKISGPGQWALDRITADLTGYGPQRRAA